ncbi:MAG: undecaprenyl-phosphate alpha-N-acetylglucosaminyl 1-phosphate transferase [Lamprocystis purpurea]|jgi:UDP-GlcNAc:undecaprenyl-phosphate GlcNAc-1-phosphate transferase|uniref:undecaprenyl-phosphate alpha-N-acetylglucosaminyl 1-phosphate transferase n=1 Tax=Lamprocystis purpurea TaxID=61598 RepID=UPI00039EFE5F|nr:undecaprenyl-phosphate alpha-N-acetylglucosaminyl 1-phosphate transferase [Lamprocystis purpurea]MBV5276089.1 undecaprenyl-phosphate alpha-N-acetylglucosaminyl 1-phosphate transferase [Lamprocystis purpurea]
MLLSFFVSATILGLLRPLAPRLRLLDHPGERRKNHAQPVPLIGGIAIFGAVMVSVLVWIPLDRPLAYGLSGAALLVVVGLLDDILDLGPKLRIVAQIAAALLLTVGGGVTLTSLGDLFGFGSLDLGLFAVPFTVFAIVGICNAFNMIDGIDGLAGGLTLIALGAVVLLSPADGAPRTLMLVTIAAIVPYLICNLQLFGCTGRKVFLGDAGSLLLGYLVVWMLITAAQSPATLEPAAAIWIVAIPLMDTFCVMGRRMLRGRSPFCADRAHLHHVLARCFNSPRKALSLILPAAAVLAGIGLLGQVQHVASAALIWAALAVFALYLFVLRYAPRLYRSLARQRTMDLRRRTSTSDALPTVGHHVVAAES